MLCSVLCPDRLYSLVQFPLALRLAEFILPLLHLLAPPGVITNYALIHGLHDEGCHKSLEVWEKQEHTHIALRLLHIVYTPYCERRKYDRRQQCCLSSCGHVGGMRQTGSALAPAPAPVSATCLSSTAMLLC
jgi:hypothetical protein